jgi:hypothetical protein
MSFKMGMILVNEWPSNLDFACLSFAALIIENVLIAHDDFTASAVESKLHLSASLLAIGDHVPI